MTKFLGNMAEPKAKIFAGIKIDPAIVIVKLLLKK